MKRTGLGDVWIGGRREEGRKRMFPSKGVWKWVDCTSWAQVVFWAPGEPNAANGDEACLSYSAFLGFKWNDLNCDREVGFLCSKKLCLTNSDVNTGSIPHISDLHYTMSHLHDDYI